MCVHLKSVTLHPERYPTRERYPFSVPVLQQTRRLSLDAHVTLFVGQNGTGKSTLLEAIATACGIDIWRPMENRRCEINPYEQKLWEHVTVDWTDGPVPGAFFGSDIARHFAFLLEEWAADDPGQLKYCVLSVRLPTKRPSITESTGAF